MLRKFLLGLLFSGLFAFASHAQYTWIVIDSADCHGHGAVTQLILPFTDCDTCAIHTYVPIADSSWSSSRDTITFWFDTLGPHPEIEDPFFLLHTGVYPSSYQTVLDTFFPLPSQGLEDSVYYLQVCSEVDTVDFATMFSVGTPPYTMQIKYDYGLSNTVTAVGGYPFEEGTLGACEGYWPQYGGLSTYRENVCLDHYTTRPQVRFWDSVGCPIWKDIKPWEGLLCFEIEVDLITPVGDTLEEVYDLCAGDSVLIYGQYYSDSGTHVYPVEINDTCRHMRTVVEYHELDTIEQTFHICSGDSLLAAGEYQTTTGVYMDIYSSAINGCDSTRITDLYVDNEILYQSAYSICLGDSIFLSGEWRFSTGTYNDTIYASSLCDTVNSHQLTVVDLPDTQDTLWICDGDSAFVGGDYQTSSGVYTDFLSNSLGCDSTVHTFLGHWPDETNDNAFICPGDSILLGGAYQTVPGTYYDTLTSVQLGCDSAVATSLQLWPEYADTLPMLSTCDGTPVWVINQYVNTAGYNNITLQSMLGCDSVITVYLDVLPVDQSAVTIDFCEGDTLQLNGNSYTQSGQVQSTFSNVFGCDSVVTYHLQTEAPQMTVDYDTMCFGDSVLHGATYLYGTINMTHTFASQLGCDSTSELHLYERPKFTPPLFYNDSTKLFTTAIGYQNYMWYRNDTLIVGATSHSLLATGPGDYRVEFANTLGCPGRSYTYDLTELQFQLHVQRSSSQTGLHIYPNPTSNNFTIELDAVDVASQATVLDMTGRVVSEFFLAGNRTMIDTKSWPVGLYLVKVTTGNGFSYDFVSVVRP